MNLVSMLGKAAKLLVLDEKTLAMVKWKLSRADSLRFRYELGPDSVVFDVGAYRGEWAGSIDAAYHCHIHAFEPIEQYCDEIRRKLGRNDKMVINNFGLSDATRECLISIDEAGSSVVKLQGDVTRIQLVDIAQYVHERGIESIDLIKINIEGGEYDLLGRMDAIGLIERCRDLQIQFHDFVPDARQRRAKLREMLSRTHRLTYDFPFIWENWQRREPSQDSRATRK
jgi:FkbM family methyltransferase